MSEHPDLTTYRNTVDAFRARDLDKLATFMHPDVVWHLPGETWFSGDVAGRQELVAFLGGVVATTGGTFTFEDVYLGGNDDHVITWQRVKATLGGDTRAFDTVTVIRYEDGLQRERWFHFPDQEGLDAFMARFA